MAPRTSRTTNKTVLNVDYTKPIVYIDRLETFVREFKIKVTNNNLSRKRLVEECFKSIHGQCDLVLNKIPKRYRDVLVGEYFGAQENKPLPSNIPVHNIQNEAVTPLTKSENNLTSEVSTNRILRSRAAKNTSSKESTKKSRKGKGTSSKRAKRRPPTGGNVESCEDIDDDSEPLSNLRTKSTAKKTYKRMMTRASENVLVEISSSSVRQVSLNDNQAAIVFTGETSSAVTVIHPKTSVVNLKFNDSSLSDLEVLYRKIGQILKSHGRLQ